MLRKLPSEKNPSLLRILSLIVHYFYKMDFIVIFCVHIMCLIILSPIH